MAEDFDGNKDHILEEQNCCTVEFFPEPLQGDKSCVFSHRKESSASMSLTVMCNAFGSLGMSAVPKDPRSWRLQIFCSTTYLSYRKQNTPAAHFP